MRRSLGRIIEGKLVLQTPCEDTRSQSQEREVPKEIEWPTFPRKMHSYRTWVDVLANELTQVARECGAAEDLMFFDSTRAQEVAQSFLISDKKDCSIEQYCTGLSWNVCERILGIVAVVDPNRSSNPLRPLLLNSSARTARSIASQ